MWHELSEKIWKATELSDRGLDKIITEWLREKAHDIAIYAEKGEGVIRDFLGLGAEKAEIGKKLCRKPEHEQPCFCEPAKPERRTWPCEHIHWDEDRLQWFYYLSPHESTIMLNRKYFESDVKFCPWCGSERPRPEKIWCSHIKLKGDTWRYEYISQTDPLISYQITIEDYENFCRVCGKERPR